MRFLTLIACLLLLGQSILSPRAASATPAEDCIQAIQTMPDANLQVILQNPASAFPALNLVGPKKDCVVGLAQLLLSYRQNTGQFLTLFETSSGAFPTPADKVAATAIGKKYSSKGVFPLTGPLEDTLAQILSRLSNRERKEFAGSGAGASFIGAAIARTGFYQLGLKLLRLEAAAPVPKLNEYAILTINNYDWLTGVVRGGESGNPPNIVDKLIQNRSAFFAEVNKDLAGYVPGVSPITMPEPVATIAPKSPDAPASVFPSLEPIALPEVPRVDLAPPMSDATAKEAINRLNLEETKAVAQELEKGLEQGNKLPGAASNKKPIRIPEDPLDLPDNLDRKLIFAEEEKAAVSVIVTLLNPSIPIAFPAVTTEPVKVVVPRDLLHNGAVIQEKPVGDENPPVDPYLSKLYKKLPDTLREKADVSADTLSATRVKAQQAINDLFGVMNADSARNQGDRSFNLRALVLGGATKAPSAAGIVHAGDIVKSLFDVTNEVLFPMAENRMRFPDQAP